MLPLSIINSLISERNFEENLFLKSTKTDAEKGYILVRGGVPGAKKSIVKIRSAVKASLQKYAVKPVIDRSVKAETAE